MIFKRLLSRLHHGAERRPKVAATFAFFIALLLCIWINGQWFWLHGVPRSGAEDLAKHIAMALNFRAAISEGQYLPRIQLQGVTVKDMPVFQYYGFFEGMAAWPFLKLGLRGLQAVTVSIVLLRWFAFVIMYATGRLLRAGPAASALAGFAYLLSPYLINNQLCRVAIAEVHAHSLLPVCLLGWALIVRGQRGWGVLVVALGMAALALAHNVFFLYTAALLALLCVLSLTDWRSSMALALGAIGGVLLAGPQWFPAFLSQPDLMVNFLDRGQPFHNVYLISLTGFLGWLRPLNVPTPPSKISYYFTFAWWTIPAVIALLWRLRRDQSRRGLIVALLGAGVTFFILTVPPVDFWAILPAPFAAVQFTYRLIAYVALLSALGLAVALPQLSWAVVICAVPLMVISQWIVIHTNTLQLGKIDLPDAQLAATYASGDYVSTSPPRSLPNNICYSDGILQEENFVRLHLVQRGLATSLQIAGYNDSPSAVGLRLAPLDATGNVMPTPTKNAVLVPVGTFSVSVPLDPRYLEQRLICVQPSFSPPDAPPPPAGILRIRSVFQSDELVELLLPSDCLEETDHHQYHRTYYILPAQVASFSPMGMLRSGDGWMREDNIIDAKPAGLRLQGANMLNEVVHLYAAKPSEPDVAQTPVIEIPPGGFDITLPLTGLSLPLRLYYSPSMVPHEQDSNSPDNRKLALMLVNDGFLLNNVLGAPIIMQTPIAYNRFWEVVHDGVPVPTFSDSLYHLCVKLQRPTGSLTFQYHSPAFCWALLAAGLGLCGIQFWFWKRLNHEPAAQWV